MINRLGYIPVLETPLIENVHGLTLASEQIVLKVCAKVNWSLAHVNCVRETRGKLCRAPFTKCTMRQLLTKGKSLRDP